MVWIHLGDDESDSDIDDVEGTNSDDLTVSQDTNENSSIDVSYNPDFMEMDKTYKHNIKIPLKFTYGV